MLITRENARIVLDKYDEKAGHELILEYSHLTAGNDDEKLMLLPYHHFQDDLRLEALANIAYWGKTWKQKLASPRNHDSSEKITLYCGRKLLHALVGILKVDFVRNMRELGGVERVRATLSALVSGKYTAVLKVGAVEIQAREIVDIWESEFPDIPLKFYFPEPF